MTGDGPASPMTRGQAIGTEADRAMMPERVSAVLFDLDGVLVDSEPVWEQVRRQVVAEHGGHWAADAQQRLMGMSTGEWARYLGQDLGVGLPPQAIAAMVIDRMKARYAEHVPFLPGAVGAVRQLAARWPLGLASSSPPVLIDAVLDGGGLRDCFAVTMSTEQVAHGKPAPDVYLEAARRLGVAPERCTAVEDSNAGIRSASSAGMRVVAIPNAAYPPDEATLQLADADADVGSLDDLTVEVLRG